MIKKILIDFVTLSTIAILIFIALDCNNSSNNSVTTPTFDNNSINGTITFVDTNVIKDTTGGYYSVNAFATWPPTGNPSGSVKIIPQKQSNNTYKASYEIPGLSNGSYVVTTAFIKIPYVQGSSVIGLGIYNTTNGCDTSHTTSCIFGSSVPTVTISSNYGVGGIDYRSWADTSKQTYKF